MTVPEGYAHSIPDCFCRDKASLLRLDHEKHVWLEHEIKSVANRTQHDIREFLLLAAEIPLQPKVTCYRLDDANRALLDLKRGRIQGSKVPRITP
jgi:propanol-preferring alcohol dehydrogenase